MILFATPFLLTTILFFSNIALTATTICNNSPALCARAYNNITYLGAHDSPFVRNETNGYSLAADQFYSSTTQLSAGVRLLTAQVQSVTTEAGATEWHLCHSYCALYDAGTLTAWLQSLKSWLDANPTDVVTILLVNSDNADGATLDAQFSAAAGIKDYVYTPASTTQAQATWPTLAELIAAGTRLVTFVASLDPTTNTEAPYLLDEFTFVFETAYNITELSSFSCAPDRPASVSGNTDMALTAHLMPLVNHFLYEDLGDDIQIPAVENITTTNSASTTLVGSLGLEADECTAAYGNRAPSFFLVDFFNVGPALQTVDRLNGVLGDTQGREDVSTNVENGDATGSVSVLTASSTSKATTGSSAGTVTITTTATIATTTAGESAGTTGTSAPTSISAGPAAATTTTSGTSRLEFLSFIVAFSILASLALV